MAMRYSGDVEVSIRQQTREKYRVRVNGTRCTFVEELTVAGDRTVDLSTNLDMVALAALRRCLDKSPGLPVGRNEHGMLTVRRNK